MLNNEVICRKLEVLLNYRNELKDYSQELNLEEYKKNKLIKRAIERTIQLIVESATDINNMILRGLGEPSATDYFNSFIELGEKAVLDMPFAIQIAPSTGLSNIIVHEYQKIDDEIVYNSIEKTLKCYSQYIKKINKYLNCFSITELGETV